MKALITALALVTQISAPSFAQRGDFGQHYNNSSPASPNYGRPAGFPIGANELTLRCGRPATGTNHRTTRAPSDLRAARSEAKCRPFDFCPAAVLARLAHRAITRRIG